MYILTSDGYSFMKAAKTENQLEEETFVIRGICCRFICYDRLDYLHCIVDSKAHGSIDDFAGVVGHT